MKLLKWASWSFHNIPKPTACRISKICNSPIKQNYRPFQSSRHPSTSHSRLDAEAGMAGNLAASGLQTERMAKTRSFGDKRESRRSSAAALSPQDHAHFRSCSYTPNLVFAFQLLLPPLQLPQRLHRLQQPDRLFALLDSWRIASRGRHRGRLRCLQCAVDMA